MSQPLRCIFFSEFDTKVGPKITFQEPEDFLRPQAFELIASYVITKPQLCHKSMTITAFGHKILGYCVYIEDPKYHRNMFQFNIGFILSLDADVAMYEPIVKKIANSFHALELEGAYLSNNVTKQGLKSILHDILNGLNDRGQCTLRVDEANTLRLKLFPSYGRVTHINDHDVPVLVADLTAFGPDDWDLAVRQILPHIDGVNYVKRVASEAEVDIEIVKKALQHLLAFGFVTMTDIFQYSNSYTVTPSIKRLSSDSVLQEECLRYVSKSKAEGNGSAATASAVQGPTIATVFRLYCSMRPGMTVRMLCATNDMKALGIDERRLITFGVVHGLLRRLHEYPILLDEFGANSVASTPSNNKTTAAVRRTGATDPSSSPGKATLSKMLNGQHNMDDVCCQHSVSRATIKEELSSMSNVVTLLK